MTPNVLDAVFDIFTKVGDWFIEIIPIILSIFWDPATGLTVIGILSVCALAIAVILLIMNWVVSFFKFRS